MKKSQAEKELLTVAKKHTNNPPGWALRSVHITGDDHTISKTSSLDKAASLLASKISSNTEDHNSLLFSTTPQNYPHDKLANFMDVLKMYLDRESG